MSHPQVTIIAYALSTRRRLCTSSGPSNWTLAASVPGPSWATNTWKWRTLRLPSRPTGQTADIAEHRQPLFWWISQCLVPCVNYVFSYCQTFHSSVEDSYQLVLLFRVLSPCFYSCFIYQACHWSEQAGLPCLVWPGPDIWDPQDALLLFVLLSKGSPAQVWILTLKKMCFMQEFLGHNVSKYAVLINQMVIICFDLLWCIFVGPMTLACWSHWVKATKNCHNKWRQRRYVCCNSQRFLVCVKIHSGLWPVFDLDRDIFCFCLVLLEGILCWRCGENGSTQTGKVSVSVFL